MDDPTPRAVPPRRVVTGHDADGRSVLLADGPTPVRRTGPGVEFFEIWSTDATPAPITAGEPDPMVRPHAIPPTAGGTVIRIAHMAPSADPTAKSARLHRTETVDYGIVLSGEIVMVLDDGAETVLRTGDIVIQRGTAHGWLNRTDAPAVVAFVLVDAGFDVDLAATLPDGFRDVLFARAVPRAAAG